MQKAERQSNIELLRIVLMLMIITHHIIVHGFGLKNIQAESYQVDNSLYIQLLINSFVVIAVNTFVFISGYFGMKFKFETIISFVLQALFYSVGIYLAFALLDPSLWNIKSLLYSFFPISRNIWWFLTAYLALYFVSPFLNKGIDSVEHSQLTIILVGFLFLDCFSGFFFGTLSETGYTFFHLFTLYILARYINKYLPRIKKASFLFVVSTVILFGSTLALLYLKELSGVWKMFSYNNPIVITSSVLFFFMFKSINFKSKIVNLLSGSVFGVYLFHDHYLTREAIAHIVNQLQYNYSGIKFVSFIFLITVSIFVFGITVELIRKSIFDKLIDKALNIWKTNRWVANKKLQIFGNNGS